MISSDAEPATAALPILDPQAHPLDDYLDPQAQELERLKALVARQALRHAVVTKQAGKRSVDARAMRDRIEALSRDHAKLQEKYTGTLEQLAEARQRELDFNSSVCGQVVQWFGERGLKPTFAADNFPNFVAHDQQHVDMMTVRFAAPPPVSSATFCLTPLSAGPLCVRQDVAVLKNLKAQWGWTILSFDILSLPHESPRSLLHHQPA